MVDGHQVVVCVGSLNEETLFCVSFDDSKAEAIDASSGSEIFVSCSFPVDCRIATTNQVLM